MGYLLTLLSIALIMAFFLLPPLSTVWLIVSFIRWIWARHRARVELKAVGGEVLIAPKKQLIISTVTAVIVWACFIGIVAVLLTQPISFM